MRGEEDIGAECVEEGVEVGGGRWVEDGEWPWGLFVSSRVDSEGSE